MVLCATARRREALLLVARTREVRRMPGRVVNAPRGYLIPPLTLVDSQRVPPTPRFIKDRRTLSRISRARLVFILTGGGVEKCFVNKALRESL